jgi:hypothetical protein
MGTMEPPDKNLLDQVRACPESSKDLQRESPFHSIDYLLYQQYKPNVVLVSSPESAIPGVNLGLGVS